ncbi:MAG: hypothetical protein HFJ17_02715 [Clostridia bacterium]|nr:hypothetical protein [Clostridia bacterium]
MIENTINYKGIIYEKNKVINSKGKIYIEYRNEELRKIKFFEVCNNEIQEITDKKELKDVIEQNYIIEG